MTNSEHSRFDADHFKVCQDCYEDHLDFMQEANLEAQMDRDDEN